MNEITVSVDVLTHCEHEDILDGEYKALMHLWIRTIKGFVH